MVKIKVSESGNTEILNTETDRSLLDILRGEGYQIYAPCGGKGTCGKCMVNIAGEGNMMSCLYFPDKNIEVFLPGKNVANILISQTEFLEDIPFKNNNKHIVPNPYGVAIDIGTTTVVLYFLDLLSGHIGKIASLLNPQNIFGADVISRINYCQEHKNGLQELQRVIKNAINNEIDKFGGKRGIGSDNIEKVVIAGNTTMLHLILGEDPVPIALAPFRPKFTGMQIRKGISSGLNVNPGAEIITLPCISAYVGADIVAGLSAIKPLYSNYLFLDIGTNGEMALIKGRKIFTCATAAGPAFEGASLSCGMGAVTGAVCSFAGDNNFQVIDNSEPLGICGSGIVDITAYLLKNELIDESGLLKETFIIHPGNKIMVNQQDIREIQLAKSAIYSGIKTLLNHSQLTYDDIDALYLAGGFGNYINISSAIRIGLLPSELKNRIFPVGNSAGIGALQYLKSDDFEKKITGILEHSEYIELSGSDEFTTEFVMNMNFT